MTLILQSAKPLISKLYKENRAAIVFVVKMGLFILAGEVFFHFVWHNEKWLSTYNEISLVVIDVILHHCAFLLEILQYDIEIDSLNRILRLKGTVGVTVGEPCIGYEVTALFIVLIISCKGSIKRKLWFIPAGSLIIYLLNLTRICALALLVQIDPEIWELNHKLIFTLVVYVFIFLMWRYWLYLSAIKNS